MKDWKGCRGLGPLVAAHVTNAMPPYLIANESKSPFPFSASNTSSLKYHDLYFEPGDVDYLRSAAPMVSPALAESRALGLGAMATPPNTASQSETTPPTEPPNPVATCWEILTLRLGRFAREQTEKHGSNSITDAMLQSQARLILYDEDDAWHQTAADNPEWLNLFKKAHGIANVDESQSILVGDTLQHEILEDLGLRPESQTDPSFNINNFGCVTKTMGDPVANALAYEFSLSGSIAGSRFIQASSSLPHSAPGLTASATTSGASNLPVTTFSDFQSLTTPIDELECTGAGGLCLGEDGELGLATATGKCMRSKTPSFFPDALGTTGFDISMPTMVETCFAPAGEANALNPYHVDQLDWDKLNNEINFASTMSGMSAGMPVTSAWNDSELTFDLDMDLDMVFEMGADGV